MVFQKLRKEFLARPNIASILQNFDLKGEEDDHFKEESFNETARIFAQSWQYSKKEEIEEIAAGTKHCAWYSDKTDIGIHKMFWRKQLSRPFFSGGNPPCPLLTTLCMQRQEQDFCFECHSSLEFHHWLEGHARAMKIMPTMLTGRHTSNCIHNAYKVAATSVRNFTDEHDGIPAKKLIELHADRWQGKTRKNKWLSTTAMEAFMLNDENTETMVIQKCDMASHYANSMKQANVMREMNTKKNG